MLQRIKMETVIFKNRREAGRQLAKALIKRGYKSENTLVLGIPRGGLVVADEVAKALFATLDVVVARKLRVPYQPELGIGAVVDGDHTVFNEEVLRSAGQVKITSTGKLLTRKRRASGDYDFTAASIPPRKWLEKQSSSSMMALQRDIRFVPPWKASINAVPTGWWQQHLSRPVTVQKC